MSYTIGEISKITGIAVPTLRYYDKEGLFNNIERSEGGIRKFSDAELLTIKWINCLKSTGMTLKDVKQYLDMNLEGDETLQSRFELFNEREIAVKEQMKELEKTMAMVNIKQWWYKTSLELGNEQAVRDMKPTEFPKDIYDKMIIAFGEEAVQE